MPTERGQPLLCWVRVGRAGMSPLQWACPRDPRAGSAWTRGPPRPLPHGQEEILPWRPLAGTGGHPGQIREGAARHRHGCQSQVLPYFTLRVLHLATSPRSTWHCCCSEAEAIAPSPDPNQG